MLEIKVLFKNKDILVIEKPAGMVVHHDARHKSETVVDWLLENYPDVESVGEDPERPGIVHRLDKDTSGVLIIARNQKSFLHLKKLFQTGGVRKIYNALVVGNVKNDSGIINASIARSTKHFEKRVVGGKQGRAREAITEYKVAGRIKLSGGEFTLLEVRPRTGRTHQIRSHLAHLGHPVVCDNLYGGKRFVCPVGLGRQFLHASSVEFVGLSGKKIYIKASLPKDLRDAIKQLRNGA